MKKIFIIIGIIIFGLCSQSQAMGGYTNLVAGYRFEDNASATQIMDYSGNNGIGTITGAVSSIGKCGVGKRFDGDDIITIADSEKLDITTAISIVAWVRPTQLGDVRFIFDKNTAVSNFAYRFLKSAANKVQFTLYTTGEVDRTALSVSTIGTNTYTHIAGTYDGINIKIYVNGILENTSSATGLITTSNSSLLIGKNVDNSSQNWIGDMDEIAIFNRGLTESEVRQTMLGLSPGE